MSRKILSVLLAAFLVVGFASFMTKADVTGSFNAFVSVTPIPCGALSIGMSGFPTGIPAICEETFPKIDFETDLNIRWTVSGLTLGVDTIVGFAGFEQILTSLKATLGALNITDQFFFATPFGTDTVIFTGNNGTTNVQTFSEPIDTPICTGKVSVDPTSHGVFCSSYAPLFVKKRVDVSISIAGITLDNLAEIGDWNFPMGPVTGCGGAPGAPCTSLPKQSDSRYFPNYTSASQSFAFGDSLTISGQTVSGITVSNTTGINLDTQLFEAFKKVDFPGLLCQGVKEFIDVSGIPVATGITAEEQLQFQLLAVGLIGPAPACPFTGPFTMTTILGISTALGQFSVTLTSSLPTTTILSSASLSFSSGALSIEQTFNSALQPVSLTATLAATLNPDSNPASLTLTLVDCDAPSPGGSCTPGIEEIASSLAVSRSGLTLTTNAALTPGAAGVSLSTLSFVLAATAGPVNLGATISVLPTWTGAFSFGVNF